MDTTRNKDTMTNPDDLAELLKHCLIAVETHLQHLNDPDSHKLHAGLTDQDVLMPCQACGDPDPSTSSPAPHNNNCDSGSHVVQARAYPGRGPGRPGTDHPHTDRPVTASDSRGRRDRKREARAVHRVAPDGQLVAEEKPPCSHRLVLPVCIEHVHQGVLRSGAMLYSACKDHHGAETVLVFCRHPAWQAAHFTSAELAKLLLYYYTVTREEDRPRGLTVIVDARGTTLPVLNMLLETLYTVQANQEGTVNITHVLADRVAQSLLFRSPVFRPQVNLRIDLVTSIETLFKFVPRQGLPPQLGGSLHPQHNAWCNFRLKLEPFLRKCRHAAELLVGTMQQMASGDTPPASVKDASRLIEQQRECVSEVLGSSTLVELQNSGDRVLSELGAHKQQLVANENYRSSMDTAGRLYNQLNVTVKKLVHLAEERLQKLELCRRLRHLESDAQQILSWINTDGEDILKQFNTISDNLKGIRGQQKDFEKVYFIAMTQLDKASDLLEEAKLINQPDVSESTGVKDISKDLRCHMTEYSSKLEDMRERIENTSECYHLLDKSYEWALGAMKYAASVKTDKDTTAESIDRLMTSLGVYMSEHPPVSTETFDMMLDLAKRLNNEKLYDQCKVAQTRCLETDQLLQERSAKLAQVKDRLHREHERHLLKSTPKDVQTSPKVQHSRLSSPNVSQTSADSAVVSPSTSEEYSPVVSRHAHGAFASRDLYISHLMSMLRRRSYAGKPSAPLYSPGVAAFKDSMRDMNLWEYEEYLFNEGLITEDMSDRIVAHLPKGLSDSTLRGSRESLRGSMENLSSSLGESPSIDQRDGSLPREISAAILQDMKAAGHVPPSPSLSKSAHKSHRPHRKMLKKASSCSLPEGNCMSPEAVLPSIRERRSNKSISMITGSNDSLPCMPEEDDVSSSQQLERTDSALPLSPPITTERKFGWSPVPVNTHLLQRQQARPQFTSSHSMADLRVTEEEVKRRRTLAHILHEMIQTERDYVKSLQFIIDHYLPEMSREDIPQCLRGKRNIIFGNMEKIYEFHSTQFLSALERCQSNPYQICRCFLDHVQEFFLYALYNKNKPKSDVLMGEYGMAFFKHKQVELGDRMDLNSYLLKPVQRMGKYSLLLRQIIKECPESEPEYNDLVAAVEMVKFQLRHGNDLLAMDCLKACDVNLQEQGMLLRQDEFLVWQGRKKCLRHVFLFEEMVLFSKTKRSSSGSDAYVYKNSIKTSDLGLTETSNADSRHKFEIWFRKRTASDTYTLQAPTLDVKNSWIREISMLLWKQAFRNRERRLSEAARMGIGRKPCMDLKASADNIQDRFINVSVGRQVPRMRNSIAVTSFDHLRNGSKRPHSLISVSSSTSSSGASSQSANSGPNQSVPHSVGGVSTGTDMAQGGLSHIHRESEQIMSPKTYTRYSNESGIEVDLNMSMASNMSVMEDACTQTTLKRPPRRKGNCLPDDTSIASPPQAPVLILANSDHRLCTDV